MATITAKVTIKISETQLRKDYFSYLYWYTDLYSSYSFNRKKLIKQHIKRYKLKQILHDKHYSKYVKDQMIGEYESPDIFSLCANNIRIKFCVDDVCVIIT